MGRKSSDKIRIKNKKKLNEIVSKLKLVFSKHGTSKYTMDAIATEIGISKSTLYQYFSNKDEMVDAVFDAFVNEINLIKEIIHQNKITYKQRYIDFIAAFSKFYSNISISFLKDIIQYHPTIWQEIKNINKTFSEIGNQFYKDGVVAGEFNEIGINAIKNTDQYLISILSNIDFLEQNNLTIQNIFDNYYQLKLNAILKDK